MPGFFSSLFRRTPDKEKERIPTAEDLNQYFKKGTALIEPYVFLSGKSPLQNKDAVANILEGIKYLDVVTAIAPDNFAPFWLKGKAYQALARHDEACYEFEQSFTLNKSNPDVARELAIECMNLGKAQRAIDVLLHALTLDSRDAGMVANLSLAYLLHGDLELSDKTIDKAITAKPTDGINLSLKKIIGEVISGKRERPRKYDDLT